MANNQFTYKDAGVDIAAGNELVSRIKKIAAQIPSKNKLNSISFTIKAFQRRYLPDKVTGEIDKKTLKISLFFAKKYTKASLASIGSQIGKRDHATVLHACKTVDNLSSTDKQFRKFVEDLGKKLSV